ALSAFLSKWFDSHAFQAVTTADFLEFLAAELPQASEGMDLHAWIEEPGLPDDAPRTTSPILQGVDKQREALLSGTPAAELDVSDWSTQAWLRFLKAMPTEAGSAPMPELDAAFSLTAAGNSEILAAWLELSIRQDYEPSYERLERFLLDVGRRKFLSPLYRALMETPAGAERARSIYSEARPRYHAVSAQTLDGIVTKG
ncbi:MAG: leukotriene-A4 hydrolase, partial [Planctomycetota bacterium]